MQFTFENVVEIPPEILRRAEATESTTEKEELPDLMLAVTPEVASSLFL